MVYIYIAIQSTDEIFVLIQVGNERSM